MSAHSACRGCGCVAGNGAAVHVVVAALLVEDLNGAIDAGLLTVTACPACSPACGANLHAAREARLTALAARERYRARNARLLRRATEAAARRSQVFSPDTAPATGALETTAMGSATPANSPPAPAPPLPPAAAAALARARIRASGLPKP